MKLNKLFMFIIGIMLLSVLVYSVDFTPQGNINLRGIYGIKNGTDLNTTTINTENLNVNYLNAIHVNMSSVNVTDLSLVNLNVTTLSSETINVTVSAYHNITRYGSACVRYNGTALIMESSCTV